MAKPGSASNVISHWHHPIENFQTSPLEFYTTVEAALQPRRIPDATTSRVDWKEGGLLSARREYLRVQRRKLAFDICAAPFGTGFFFSWWLAEVPPAHGLLYLLGIFFASFVFFGMSMLIFGIFWGFFLAVITFPFLLGFLGYAIHEGNFGPGAEDVLLVIPILGWLYDRLFKPVTYYKMDTTLMFQSAVHAAVLEVVDQVTSSKGIRALTELERKPIMREFYRR